MAAAPKEEDQALALLTSELQNQGDQFGAEAQMRIANTNFNANVQQGDAQQGGVANDYVRMTQSTNANASGNSDASAGRHIGVLPAGSKILSTKNVTLSTDPSTGTINVTAPVTQPVAKPIQPIPQAVTDIYSQYQSTQQNGPKLFNVDQAIRDISVLNGEAKGIATMQVISNIDTQYALRVGMLRKQAEFEAGVHEAEASIQKWTQASILKHIDPAQSMQVVNAIAVRTQALAAATAKANIAITADPELIKLNTSKDLINKMLQKQMTVDERMQAVVDAVPTTALVASQLINGTTGDEFKDRAMAAKWAQTDPQGKILHQFSPETAPTLLTHPDAGIRAGALKLLVQQDVALNRTANILDPLDPTKTKVSRIVEQVINMDASAIAKKYFGDDKELSNKLVIAKGKDAQELHALVKTNAVVKVVEDAFVASWMDAKGWKGTTTLPEQPLGKTIANVSASNKGKASMGDVVKSFIQDDTIKGANDQPLNFQEKLAILESTVNNTASAEVKSILVRDPVAIRNKTFNNIKNIAARAYASYMLSAPSLQGSAFSRDEQSPFIGGRE